ncbi:MAG: adenylate/guanylate cyclase domain-containing protein [Cyanobacteria bacterium P01_A01_bin.17]
MSKDLSSSPAIPPHFASLSRAHLIEIILQQQQKIDQLTSGVQSATEAVASASLTSPFAQEYLQQPNLRIQTKTGHSFLPLEGSSFWTIGRGSDNSIVLNDQWMSRNHAMLQKMGMGETYLIDLGSHNGSFVNGRRVSVPIALQHQDLLTFGQTNVEFLAPANPSEVSGYETLTAEEPATALLHLRRLISVLVVDIRNFTGLTHSLDERLLSEVVGTWFRCAGEIIRDHGSWVDKYIGDAVMAVWIHGAQEVGIEEIQRPFLALQALHKMTSELHHTYPLPFPLRIGAGVNTGYAMVGNTGSSERPDYTALGDTVNAAFRLETSTKQLGLDIAVGLETYQGLKQWQGDCLPFRRYSVRWKGYEETTPAYGCSFADLTLFLQMPS